MDNFYSTIESYVKDEAHDHEKYFDLAKKAPTEKARKILVDIGREEKRHHDFLEEILSDRDTESEVMASSKSEPSAKLSTDRKIDYPTHIENAGVDPDVIK
jgi:rubrerythrin